MPSAGGGRAAIFADCERSAQSTGLGGLEALRGGTLLITGASGFVGCWLLATIAHLNDSHGFGIEALALSRRPDGLANQAPFLAGRNDVRVIAADVRQYVSIPGDTGWIIHAAANPDSRHHATSPIETASVIGDGTARILRLAEQLPGLRQMLHLSSGLVGAPHPAQPRASTSTVYVDSKRFSEALCAAYRTQSRLPLVVTRPFTFFGPFQALDAPWAANNFLHAAIEGQPLKLLGGGDTVRSYLYGSDMAMLALHQLAQGKSGETYDLGGIEEVSLLDLAQIVVGQAKRPLEIRLNTATRQPGATRLVPDMARSVAAFGFKPAFSPAEAVARTLEWHREAKGKRPAGQGERA